MIKIDFHIHTKASILDAAFEFSQTKLDEYIEAAGLDCIAITNHNLFDKEQFIAIRNSVSVPVFPGIEVDLAKAQILVFCDGQDLDHFEELCSQVTAKCAVVGASITVEEFEGIFGNLRNYILIPHYDKKPAIKESTLAQLSPHVTAGEVSRRPASFAQAFKAYADPYKFLQELKAIGGDVICPRRCAPPPRIFWAR